MAANLNESEWELLESISETFALPESMDFKDPEAFNRLVRSRIPARGKRFTHDHHDTCAYIARSKNANVVAYTANFVVPTASAAAPSQEQQQDPHHHQHHHHHTAPQQSQQVPPGFSFVSSGCQVDCTFNPQNPIHPYFVNLEPSYIEARRKKGIQGDCDDLKMLERKFAYGYNTKAVDLVKTVREQLPTRLKEDSKINMSVAIAAATNGDGDDAAAKKEVLGKLADWWQPLTPMMGTFVALPVWPVMLVRLKPLTNASSSASSAEASSWCSDADTVPVVLAMIDKKISVLEKVYVKSIERWLRLPTVEYIEVFGVGLEDGKPTYEKQTNNGQYQPPTDVSKEDLAEALKN